MVFSIPSLPEITVHDRPRSRRPVFTRPADSISDMFVLREHEKRQSLRRCIHCRIEFIPHPENEPYPTDIAPNAQPLIGRCCNISDTGMYGIVPARYGVAVGQNFLFRFHIGECGPEPGLGRPVSQHGRILRAELFSAADGAMSEVGIAVLLYGHREGVVPMPMRI
jgi:hypothetical protein